MGAFGPNSMLMPMPMLMLLAHIGIAVPGIHFNGVAMNASNCWRYILVLILATYCTQLHQKQDVRKDRSDVEGELNLERLNFSRPGRERNTYLPTLPVLVA